MRKTVLLSLKRLGLKKDGFLDNAFLGCKMASSHFYIIFIFFHKHISLS